MDKTPEWLNWAIRQALMVDVDTVRKMNMALGGKEQAAQHAPQEQEPNLLFNLAAMGVRIKRKGRK